MKSYAYQKDVQGSTRAVTDTDGKCVGWYEYSDFGETTIHEEQAGFENVLCYTGGVYDESSGLYYLNARYYNPEMGRFISRDTYEGKNEEPSSLHLYLYCANDPVNYVDPSGHDAIALGASYYAVTAGVAAVGTTFLTATGIALTIVAIVAVVYVNHKQYTKVSTKRSTRKNKSNGKRPNKKKTITKRKLPSSKKIKIDMEHILDRHTNNGKYLSKDKFPRNISAKSIRSMILQAYNNGKILQQQGWRIKMQGKANAWKIVMWVNYKTKIIESAWPQNSK